RFPGSAGCHPPWPRAPKTQIAPPQPYRSATSQDRRAAGPRRRPGQSAHGRRLLLRRAGAQLRWSRARRLPLQQVHWLADIGYTEAVLQRGMPPHQGLVHGIRHTPVRNVSRRRSAQLGDVHHLGKVHFEQRALAEREGDEVLRNARNPSRQWKSLACEVAFFRLNPRSVTRLDDALLEAANGVCRSMQCGCVALTQARIRDLFRRVESMLERELLSD